MRIDEENSDLAVEIRDKMISYSSERLRQISI